MNTQERIQILIALASADGELGEKERNYILSIGLANHLLIAEILPLFTPSGKAEQIYRHAHNKEQVLLELVQLMQIDKKIYQAEMRYCAGIAARLGFRQQVVFELMIRAKEFGEDPEKLKAALRSYEKT